MKIMTSEIGEKLKLLLEKQGVVLAYIFGSMAHRKVTPLSDIDIAITFSPQTPKKEYFDRELKIANEVGTLFKNDHVDVVNLETAHSPLLKYNAIFQGKLLVNNDDNKRRQIEYAVMQEQEDTEHLRIASYKIIAKRMHEQAIK